MDNNTWIVEVTAGIREVVVDTNITEVSGFHVTGFRLNHHSGQTSVVQGTIFVDKEVFQKLEEMAKECRG